MRIRRGIESWLSWFPWYRRSVRDADLARELRGHLELEAEEHQDAGLSPQQSRYAAHRALGNTLKIEEDVRAAWGFHWLETLAQDIRYALRMLRKSPAFTAVAILTLALGIGASVTVFSLVNAVLLRSLPYGDAARLVYIWTPLPRYASLPPELPPSFADIIAWRSASHSFVSITAFRQRMLILNIGGEPVRAASAIVLGNFFDNLQAAPILGRVIQERDDQPGTEGVAVISHAFWDSHFASDPAALGKIVQISGLAYRVIGVMPADFAYPHENDFPLASAQLKRTEIWIPARLNAQQRGDRMLTPDAALGRLAPGVTLRQAQVEMSAIQSRLDKLNLPEMQGSKSLLVPFIETALGPARPLMRLLCGTVILVLLIGCGNVANLLMARGVSRAGEMGVRTALGASRARLIRQVLTESFLLSACGGVLGVVLSEVAVRVLVTLNPGDISRFDEISIDGRVLLFSVLISLLTGLVFGALPALFSSRIGIHEAMRRGGGRGTTGPASRASGAFVVGDVALAVVLLTGAGLLIRSYLRVQGEATGLDSSTLTMSLAADRRAYPADRLAAIYRIAVDRLSRLPGVTAVGTTNTLPLDHTSSSSTFRVEGYPNLLNQEVDLRQVGGRYFDAMQIPLIAGRYLNDSDISNGPSTARRNVVISENFAKLYFSRQNPIGGHVQRGEPGPNWETVVGVVADVHHSSLEKAPTPALYEPSWAAESLAMRTTISPETMIAAVRSEIRQIDPGVLLTDVETMRQRTAEATARRRFQTVLLGAFAGIAVLLASVGLYSLLSYTVRQRTKEIGIRMALGADRAHVMRMVLRQGARLALVGTAIGIAAALALTRVLSGFLFEVRATDPPTYALVSLLLVIVALAACCMPARRAMKVDPMVALRYE